MLDMLQCFHQFRFHLLAIFMLLMLHAAIPLPGADSASAVELKRVQKTLADKADEIKSVDLVGYSMLMAAVKDLDKYTRDSGVDGSKLLVSLMTPANLKRLFKAPSRVNKDTGEVSIAYAMDNASLIQDWVLNAAKPEFKKGALFVSPADKLTHKGQWLGKVTITGKIQMGNRSGIHMSTSTGWQVDGHSYNAWLIGFLHQGTRKAEQTFSTAYTESADTTFASFTWGLSDRIVLTYGSATIAVPLDQPFLGTFNLCGGQGGNLYKDILITGTLDPNWVKQQLGVGE